MAMGVILASLIYILIPGETADIQQISDSDRGDPTATSAKSLATSNAAGSTAVIVQNQQATSTMRTTACPGDIEYKLVKERNGERFSFTRYAAYCKEDDEPISIHSWIQTMLGEEPTISDSFTAVIRNSNYSGVFFETKGCTTATSRTKHFEFVLVDTPYLKSFAEMNASANVFGEYFRDAGSAGAVAFSNLGGTSRLIAPVPPEGADECAHDPSCSKLIAYSHLAAFCRQGSPEQVRQVWKLAVGEFDAKLKANEAAGDGKLVWFSTSGTGVPWLHLRLDRRPKYYTYRPFKDEI